MATFDMTEIFADGMGELLSQATSVIGAIAPSAIGIIGAVMAVRLGVGIFRSLVRV